MSGVDRSKPLVSVLTPAYNQGRFLGACVRSVQAQAYPHWEMVILDDASADDTRRVAERLAAGDGRIRYIRHESNYGIYRLAETYNEALAATSGDLVAVLEADDLWTPDKLSIQVPMMADTRVVLSYGNRKLVDENGEVLGLTDLRRGTENAVLCNDPVGSKFWHFLFLENRIPSETVMIRRCVLEAQGGFLQVEGCATVDFPTYFPLAAVGPFAYTDKYIGFFRRHGNNSSVGRAREYKSAYLELTSRYMESFSELWSGLGIDLKALPGQQRRIMSEHLARREFSSGLETALWAMRERRWAKARLELARLSPKAPDGAKRVALWGQYLLTFLGLDVLSRLRRH